MPVIIPGDPRTKARKTERHLRPVRTPKTVEVKARDHLYAMIKPMIAEVSAMIPGIYAGGDMAVAAVALGGMMDKWQRAFAAASEVFGTEWADGVDAANKASLEKSIAKSLGVDFAGVLDQREVRDAFEIMRAEAVGLIRTVPTDYIGRVGEALLKSYRQEREPEGRSLIAEVEELGHITHGRAKTIARDQTSKMNANLNTIRATSLGMTEYIWRTSRDSKVVGTPGGLYPEGNRMHGNHYEREGKIFRYDKPPFDGAPGAGINCRCHSEPILDLNHLDIV